MHIVWCPFQQCCNIVYDILNLLIKLNVQKKTRKKNHNLPAHSLARTSITLRQFWCLNIFQMARIASLYSVLLLSCALNEKRQLILLSALMAFQLVLWETILYYTCCSNECFIVYDPIDSIYTLIFEKKGMKLNELKSVHCMHILTHRLRIPEFLFVSSCRCRSVFFLQINGNMNVWSNYVINIQRDRVSLSIEARKLS